MMARTPPSLPARLSYVGQLSTLVLLGACCTPQRPGASEEDVSARLQAVLDRAAAEQKSPGMVMAVQVGQATPWMGATGCQDEACSVKMTPEAAFRIGSITKSFVGAAILEQVDEGKLGLEDTLEQWLPGVFAHIDGKGITIRQLLSHHSGIENFTDSLEWNVVVYTTPTHPWNAPDELLALADGMRATNPAVIPPGSRFAYSNTNFVLLGMIAAKVDGYPVTGWRTVIQKRFLDRLGLRDSHIPVRGEVGLGGSNHGYVNFYNLFFNPLAGTSECVALNPPCTDTDVDVTRQDVSSADAAGAIVSTAGDLLTWTRAFTHGELLSPQVRQWQQTFSRVCTPPEPGCHELSDQVGLALFRQPKYGFIGIRGEIFGFNGTIQYLPEKELTVVVLSNRTGLDHRHVGPVPDAVVEVLYPGFIPLSHPVGSGTPSGPVDSRTSLSH